MRKFIFGLVLSIPLLAQQPGQPNCQFTYEITNRTSEPTDGKSIIAISGGTARTPSINNRNQQCSAWTMNVAVDGLSAVSLELDSSQNSYTIQGGTPTAWAAFGGNILSGSNPSTSITSFQTSFSGYFPWLSVSLGSSTGTGSIYVTLYGWKSTAYLASGGVFSSLTGQTGTSTFTVATPTQNTMYQLWLYFECTVQGTGTLTPVLSYTNPEAAAQSATFAGPTFTTGVDSQNNGKIYHVKGGTSMVITSTASALTGTYNVYAYVVPVATI